MAKFSVDSKFLGYTDISDVEDTIVTITDYDRQQVGMGHTANEKWILYFKEFKKGLALNKTNGKILCIAFDSDDMDDWKGRKIALYVKDDVEFQGDIVSAIRIRTKLPEEKKRAASYNGQAAKDFVEKFSICQTPSETFGVLMEVGGCNELSEADRKSLWILGQQTLERLGK